MASTNMVDRFNEMAALAAVTSVIQILGDLVKEPNGKRYTRTVEQRRERWLQLSSLAEQQAQRTVAAQPKRKAATKPTIKPTTPPADAAVA